MTGFTPNCTVIIPTFGRTAELEDCLRAVSQLKYKNFDVLVVDNGPLQNGTDLRARKWGANYLRVILRGVSRARNQGARAAHGDIIAFLDDDATPEPNWLSEIVKEFQDPQVMAVSGRILLPINKSEAENFFASYGGFDAGSEWRIIDRTTSAGFVLVNFGAMSGGANMAFRRAVFDEWPGFDERLGRGATQNCNEEPHAYSALVDRGYRVVYTPAAVVRHPGPKTMKDLRGRHLRDTAWASAYMTLLAIEQPHHRREVLRYAWQAVSGKARTWRPVPAFRRHQIIPRWQERLTWLLGPFLYFRARMAARWFSRIDPRTLQK